MGWLKIVNLHSESHGGGHELPPLFLYLLSNFDSSGENIKASIVEVTGIAEWQPNNNRKIITSRPNRVIQINSEKFMIDKNEVRRFVEEAIASTDAFVVDVTVSTANDIVVEIDSPTGVDLDFCAELNRKLNEVIDREVEDYSLEVGSASLTAPFKVRGQYEKNLGNEVEVLTRDGKKFKGVLTDVGDNDFTVEVVKKVKEPGAKRPVMVAEPIAVAYDNAKQVCYVINFK